MIVTIDGPAASGKSTIAQAVAQEMDLYYIASGSLYRALSYILINHFGYSLKDINDPKEEALEKALDSKKFKYTYNKSTGVHIFFEDSEISALLKSELISSAASIMATNALVHKHLIQFQRKLAEDHSIIIDGRNCGSEVFPHAEVKIYMTASEEIRAKRWQKVQAKVGNHIDLQEALKEIKERDKRDSQRSVSPLMVPKNGIIIDNSAMDIKESVAKVIYIIKQYV